MISFENIKQRIKKNMWKYFTNCGLRVRHPRKYLSNKTAVNVLKNI